MRKQKRPALQRKVPLIRFAALLIPMLLAGLLLSQTALAKTYVITDGSRVFTYTTYATNPEDVLDEAGLELGQHDAFTTDADSITIRRAQRITVSYYGEATTVTSFGETVGQLLSRLNIHLTDTDVLSHSLDTETYENMQLQIDEVVTQQQTYTTTLSHEITYCYDASLPEGMQEVLTPGVDGEALCTAEVTYVNSKETGRTVLSQDVILPPVSEVVAIGTGAAIEAVDPDAMPVIGENTITLPTGEVLSYTGSMVCGATAYYNRGTTATGTQAREGVVAVDPSVIPHGTRMFIITNDGEYIYGIACAEDAGDSNIIGSRIDIWFPTRSECVQFGYRQCTVYFLGSE